MMPVTTISATPLSANGTVETGWIYIADGLYNNVGVIAGADTSGAINILFSNDGSTTLVEMTGVCNTSNLMNNGVMVQGVLQYGGYSNLGVVNSLLIAPYMKIEYVNGSTAQTKFMFGYYFYGRDDYIFTRQDAITLIDIGYIKAVALDLVDSAILYDQLSYKLGLVLFESGSLHDVFGKAIFKRFNDSIPLADSTSKAIFLNYVAAIILSDYVERALNITESDKTILVDYFNKAVDLARLDTVQVADLGAVVRTLFLLRINDSISLVDAGFTKIINYVLSDVAALSDLGKQLLMAIRKVDSITLSDALHYILGLLIFDNGVSLSDTAVYNLNKVFLDNFGIHDLGTRLLISKAYLEHLNITDALIKNLQIKNTDYFGISDMHNKAIAVVNTELAELRDFVNKEVAVGFEELTSVTDRGATVIIIIQDIMMYVTGILNKAGVSTMILYNIKAVDIQRTGTFAAVWKNSEQDTYVGFGREAFGDYSVTADLWVYGGNNRFQADSIISKIHSIVEGYNPVLQPVLSNGDVLVWVKLISEENIQSKYRGALLYRFVFQCRVWRKMNE